MRITDKIEASIAIERLLIKTSFVLVQDIYHSKVNYYHISSKMKGITFLFPFLEKPKTRNLNIIKACSIHDNHINLIIKGKQVDLKTLKRKLSL